MSEHLSGHRSIIDRVVPVAAITCLLLMFFGFIAYLALPKWLNGWGIGAIVIGVLGGVGLALWVRGRRHPVQRRRSDRRFGVGAGALALGTLLGWVFACAMTGPIVIGAWSIGDAPQGVRADRFERHDCRKCSDKVFYTVDGTAYEQELSTTIFGSRERGSKPDLVLDPAAPTHVMTKRDYDVGRHPAAQLALTGTTLAFIGVMIYLGRIQRPSPSGGQRGCGSG